MEEWVELLLEIKAETGKALLVSDGGQNVWLPKSQIEYTEQGGKGDEIVFEIPEWLALEKGLI